MLNPLDLSMRHASSTEAQLSASSPPTSDGMGSAAPVEDDFSLLHIGGGAQTPPEPGPSPSGGPGGLAALPPIAAHRPPPADFTKNDDSYVDTVNRMGVAWKTLSPLSQKFIAFLSGHRGLKVLDVGAGYGTASIAALKAGAHVVANDLSCQHLETLRDRVRQDAEFSSVQRRRLSFFAGDFSRKGFDLAGQDLDAVHAAWVLHFMSGRELIEAVAHMFYALKPGGRVFVSVAPLTPSESPRLAEAMAQRRLRGELWAGFFERTDLIDFGAWTHMGRRNVTGRYHFFTEEVLEMVFSRGGFEVLECGAGLRASTNGLQKDELKKDIYLVARKRLKHDPQATTAGLLPLSLGVVPDGF
jgi:SAM-dependent methyltransferase